MLRAAIASSTASASAAAAVRTRRVGALALATARSSRSGGGGKQLGTAAVVRASSDLSSSSLPASRLGDDDDHDADGETHRPVGRRRTTTPLSRGNGLSPGIASCGSVLSRSHDDHASSSSSSAVRSYHATPRREILPLVALALVGVTVRYSYKALQRMDEEWEDYEEAVREYEANGGVVDVDVGGSSRGERSKVSGSRASAVSSSFRGGVMGIDLGTVNLRVSHAKSGGKAEQQLPGVVVDREGGRFTPAAVYFDGDDASEAPVWGRLAASKAHERPDDVLSPHSLLLDGNTADDGELARMNASVEGVLRPACRNALEQVLPPSSMSGGSGTSASSPLFSVDPASTGGGYNVRPAFAYPPVEDGNTGEWDAGYVSRYQAAIASLSSPPSAAAFVPEPVAAVVGARTLGVLPPSSAGGSGTILVLDVGGRVTSASLVAPSSSDNAKHEGEYDVLECLRLPSLGGESLVEALVEHVARDFFNVNSAAEVGDGTALQRLHDAARGAVLEVSGGKRRVQLNVPYLTVDAQMRPRHLDVGVSVDVLEAEVDEFVKARSDEYRATGALSTNMPDAKDLSSALSSLVMKVLEEGGTNPFELEAVLVAGGGARSPIVQRAVRRGLASIAGEQFVAEKVIVPEAEMIEELVVLGAAVVGGKS